MSAIATTTLIPVAALDALRDAAPPRKGLLGGKKDGFPTALARHGRALEVFERSGYLLGTVFVYLDERGIDLMHSRHDEVASVLTKARGSTFFILGEEHAPLAGKLVNVGASVGELTEYFNAFNEADEGPEIGEGMGDAIRFLGRALEAVTPGNVVLLAIL